MMKDMLLKLVLLHVLFSLSASVSADDNDQELARALTKSGEIVPLDSVIAKALAEAGGNLLEADLDTKNNSYVYELQILMSDGVVWEYVYDARNGALINKKKER